jgi:hypothetical protein
MEQMRDKRMFRTAEEREDVSCSSGTRRAERLLEGVSNKGRDEGG